MQLEGAASNASVPQGLKDYLTMHLERGGLNEVSTNGGQGRKAKICRPLSVEGGTTSSRLAPTQ